jgi:biotin carboxyl carrier protein
MNEPLRATIEGAEPLVVDVRAAAGGHAATDDTETGAAPPMRRPIVRRLAGGPAGARYEVVVDGWRFEVDVEPAARAALRDRASRGGTTGRGGGRHVVRAQIPGRILAVLVAAGDVVDAGQALLTVEAMKMENAVPAPWPGTIARVGAVAGQTVELGDELVEIE